MTEINSSSVRALGLGLMFVGASIVFTSGIFFLMSLLVSEDDIWRNMPAGNDVFPNPFIQIVNMTPVWAGIIIFGLFYIYAASRLRELERWGYLAIIVLSVSLPFVVLAVVLFFLRDFSGFGFMAVPSVFGLSVYSAVLVWYLSKKDVKVHFTS